MRMFSSEKPFMVHRLFVFHRRIYGISFWSQRLSSIFFMFSQSVSYVLGDSERNSMHMRLTVIQLLESSRRLKCFSSNVCNQPSGFRENRIWSLFNDLNVLIHSFVYKIQEYEGAIRSLFPPIYSSLKCTSYLNETGLFTFSFLFFLFYI